MHEPGSCVGCTPTAEESPLAQRDPNLDYNRANPSNRGPMPTRDTALAAYEQVAALLLASCGGPSLPSPTVRVEPGQGTDDTAITQVVARRSKETT